jgi:hypothetical protein
MPGRMSRNLCLTLVAVALYAGPGLAQPLPDGEVTRAAGMVAYLVAPTTRYSHGALGDAIEAGGFAVISDGQTRQFMLPQTDVFEDLRVRLQDMDGDGQGEAVVIQTHQDLGASIAVYDLGSGPIRLMAKSPYIGQARRWLNIAGFADFVGDGTVQVAAVVTPHLAGSLRIYHLRGTDLVESARIDGFTNHHYGARALDLARLADANGDGVVDITLHQIDGSGDATVTFAGGRPQVLTP